VANSGEGRASAACLPFWRALALPLPPALTLPPHRCNTCLPHRLYLLPACAAAAFSAALGGAAAPSARAKTAERRGVLAALALAAAEHGLAFLLLAV